MKKIIIIGANEFQNKLVQKANDLGMETHTIAWEDGAIAKDNSDYFYPISITDKNAILEIAKEVQPDGITSIASDLAMPTVNYAANQMNLPGNSEQTTLVTTNKYEMRKRLLENVLPNPKFYFINDEGEIPEDLIYPLIIKPIDRSGSRGIYKVENKDELKTSIKSVNAVSFVDSFLIEEFIDGKEFSVEYISENGKHKFLQITEKFTTGAPHFIEKGHLQPARISAENLNKVKDIVEKSLNSLGVESGASHSEIKINEKGQIYIIEIAARMGGDFIGSDLVALSTGYDYVENVIKVSLGEKIDNKLIDNEHYSMVFFIFNDSDQIILNKIVHDYEKNVVEYFIDSNLQEVIDSSTRNGYCIMKFDSIEEVENVIKITKLEE